MLTSGQCFRPWVAPRVPARGCDSPADGLAGMAVGPSAGSHVIFARCPVGRSRPLRDSGTVLHSLEILRTK